MNIKKISAAVMAAAVMSAPMPVMADEVRFENNDSVSVSVSDERYASKSDKIEIIGNNIYENDYLCDFPHPDYSFLTKTEDGYMRVQADVEPYLISKGWDSSNILIEYYDEKFNFLSQRFVKCELDLFGAFYETEDNYFIVSGQENPKEKNDVEVIRVTKYDKDWKRIDAASLYGENTTVSFYVGKVRLAHDNDRLIVRTCHQMYTSRDGLNHQANLTFEVDIDSMSVTETASLVANSRFGYVSHSFDQFIQYDGDYTVAVDLGDAYPRSVVLNKGDDLRSTEVELLPISGEIGENYTGVQLGGFEISDSSYIVAGKSIDQSRFSLDRNSNNANIFVTTVDRDLSGEPRTTFITDFPYGSASVTNPYLIKINDDKFMLLWQRESKFDDSTSIDDGLFVYQGKIDFLNETYYTFLNGEGLQTSKIQKINADLSDCKPIVEDDRLIWYTSEAKGVSPGNVKPSVLTFYTLSLNDGKVLKIEHKPDETEYKTINAIAYGPGIILINNYDVGLYRAREGDVLKMETVPAPQGMLDSITLSTYSGKNVGVSADNTFIMPEDSVTIIAKFRTVDDSERLKAEQFNSELLEKIENSKAGDVIKADGDTYITQEVIRRAADKNVDLEINVNNKFAWNIEPDKLSGLGQSISLSVKGNAADDEKLRKYVLKSNGETDAIDMCFSIGAEFSGTGITLIAQMSEAGKIGKFCNVYIDNSDGSWKFIKTQRVDASDPFLKLPATEAGTYTLVTSTESKTPGDINNDCKVDLSDITAMLNKYVNNSNLTAANEFKMDYDNDGKCGLSDVIALLNDYVNGRVN